MFLFLAIALVPGLIGQPRSGTPARMTMTPVQVAQPEHLWRFVSPATMVVAGVRLRVLRESEAWRTAMEQVGGLAPVQQAGMLHSLADIDEVWVAADKGPGSQPVLVMRGRFDGPVWRNQLAAGYRAGVSIDTLLMGTAAGISTARRRIGATAAAVEMAAVARQLAADHDIWIVANSQELIQQGLKPAAGVPEAFTHLRGLALGIRLQDPMIAEVRAESDSAEAAAELMGWIRRSVEEQKEWRDAGGKMDLRQDGKTIHLRMEVDAAKTRTMIAERSQPRPVREPVPAKPRKVVIHGMEGGPREIPYGAVRQ